MSRRWVLIIVALNLVGLVALAFIYPHLMVSPGPLIKAHTELATDCFACHVPLLGSSSDKCVGCHAKADIGLRTTKGQLLVHQPAKPAFHQALSGTNCMACHSDHAAPRLTQSGRKRFSHAMLGAEVQSKCESCHQKPADTLHRQISTNCLQCHSSVAWKPATFNHDKFFVLDKDHNATCETCHVKSDFTRFTCYGCHEHTQSKVEREHTKEGISNFSNCVECHRSAHGEPGRGEGGGGREKTDKKRKDD